MGTTVLLHGHWNRRSMSHDASVEQEQAVLDGLLSWFKDHGGESGLLHPELFGDGIGRGLVASSDVEQGQPVCSIPFELVVSTALAEEALVIKELPPGLLLQREVLLLALFLVQESRNPESMWTSWIASLPTGVSFSTSFRWTEEELANLDASQLRQDTLLRRQKVKNDYSILAPLLVPALGDVSCELFEWALSNVWSRSFYLEIPAGENGFGLAGDEHVCLMIPYCDLINHTNIPSGFKVDFDAKRIVLHAAAGAGQGTQVFDCYGCKSNAILLLNYGFVLNDNEHDTVVLCVKQPSMTDNDPELVEIKQQLLKGHHLDMTMQCPISLSQLLPADLIAFMRIAHLQSASEALSSKGKLRSAAQPYSLTNESRTLKSLVRLAQGLLSKNQT